VAEIDLQTLGGTGHLVIVDDTSASVHAN